MSTPKMVGKREFIQHTSRYLKWIDEEGGELIITHHHKPDMTLTKIKLMSFSSLRGLTSIKMDGDINEPVLPGYDTWSS